MISKTLKTTHGRLKVNIPTSLHDITLGQVMALQEKQNLTDLEAISILSAVSVDELASVKNYADLMAFSEYVYTLAQQMKNLYDNDQIPRRISFIQGNKKKTIPVLGNLSVEPAGAFMAAREIIAEEIGEYITLHGEDNWNEYFNPSLKACCQVLAHYFYCRATGNRYNEYEAEVFTEEIKKLSVTEALPVAKYFFLSFPNLLRQKTNFFQRLLQRWRKKPAYRHLKSLNISTP
jgi:hypothetical protein